MEHQDWRGYYLPPPKGVHPVWSTSIGRRFGSKSCSSPCWYGSWRDRTHRRSKSCWSGLQEIGSPVASSWCIVSGIALPAIWPDDIVLSPWMRTLIRCWFFPTLVKCECLCESRPRTSNFNRKWRVEVNFNIFELIGSFKERTQTILLLVVKPAHLFAVRSTNSLRILCGYPITSQNWNCMSIRDHNTVAAFCVVKNDITSNALYSANYSGNTD